MTIDLLKPRDFYKPFDLPWAFDAWRQHEAMHWMGYEVPLAEDVKDWNEKLSENEKGLLTNLFRFFTQADVDVAQGYTQVFAPYFAHKPELAMMMSSFAAREAVHMDAYALLLETIGMDEGTYKAFHEYKEMKDKHDYLENFNTSTPFETAKSLAVYSGFTEGMQLFASFVILLNLPRHNKMKNMGNIVAWSIRDESLHVDSMTKLFKEFVSQLGEDIDIKALEVEVASICETMVALEDKFIDLCFAQGGTDGLTSEEVKNYIRYIANIRMNQLGFEPIYTHEQHTKNPLPWVDFMINGEEHANFFEQKSTFYSKAMTQGDEESVEW